MARQLRFEYPGAVNQIMVRGDGGKCIFLGNVLMAELTSWRRACKESASNLRIAVPFI